MADEYTPTTPEVRGVWAAWVNYGGGLTNAPPFLSPPDALAAFSRWLAARDREVERRAADKMREYIGREGSYDPYLRGWNRALEVVAKRIEEDT